MPQMTKTNREKGYCRPHLSHDLFIPLPYRAVMDLCQFSILRSMLNVFISASIPEVLVIFSPRKIKKIPYVFIHRLFMEFTPIRNFCGGISSSPGIVCSTIWKKLTSNFTSFATRIPTCVDSCNPVWVIVTWNIACLQTGEPARRLGKICQKSNLAFISTIKN